MRRTWLLIAFFCLFASTQAAQQSLWLHAINPNTSGVEKVIPPPSERQIIANLLRKGNPPWECEQPADFLAQLAYSAMPVSATTRVFLVQVGRGCARGGQGSNGAMWLIALDGPKPVLLAGPEQNFEGFVYSIEPTSAKGYRDIILGWHEGGGETGLAYFRFDGSAYRSISGAVLSHDEDGIPKLSPATSVDPGLVSQPSFDCAAARTATEKLVCSDNELSALDIAMAYAYRRAQGTLPSEGRNALRDDQREWLKAYARACDSVSSDVARKKCVSQFLRSRTHELSLGAAR